MSFRLPFYGNIVAILHRTVFSLPNRGRTRLTPITAAAAQPAIANLHAQFNYTDQPRQHTGLQT